MKRTLLMVLVVSFGSARLINAGGLETSGFAAMDLRLDVLDRAKSYLDVAYSYGGSDARGMDCSGLVYRVFLEAAGTRLPRTVAELYAYGMKIDGPLLPGDLVFFNTDGQTPSHVGIYIGSRQMIHTASQGHETGVIISSLEELYYRQRYLQGRRILPSGQAEIAIDLPGEELPRRLEQRLLAGYPLQIIIHSELQSGQFISLRFEREGELWLSRRIRLQPLISHLWFTPPEGNWRLVCEDAGQKVVGAFEFSTSGRKP